MPYDPSMDRSRVRARRDVGEDIVERSDEVLGGTPVFAGTRVPVQTLFDYLESGQRLDDFLDDFPTVRRDQATTALELAGRVLTARSA